MIQLFINEDRKKQHRFTVRNNQGQILYFIHGYWGRQGDFVNLFSIDGLLLLQAKQVNMSPFFKFDLNSNGEKMGSFRKHPGFFGLRDAFFTVRPHDWVIRGDFEKLYFTTFENEQKIIQTNKLIKEGNALYSLKVMREEDVPLASLLSVLLDHYYRKKNSSPNSIELKQEQYHLGLLNYKTPSDHYPIEEKLMKKGK